MTFTETDIGTRVTIETPEGIYFEQLIVQGICPICGEYMIGTIAAAGGFLTRHEHFHSREMMLATLESQA